MIIDFPAYAKEGYAIWRETFVATDSIPPHWDDLTEQDRNGFAAVAAFAFCQAAAESAEPPPIPTPKDEIVRLRRRVGTIKITRKTAQQFLMDRIMFQAFDDELRELLDAALDERLYNVRIVGDHEENDDGLLTWRQHP